MDQSLIFTVLSLSDFFAQHFPAIDWYPYWYLGNPYHYLIGPIVPVLIVFFSKLLHLSLYHSYIVLIVTSLLGSAVGTYFFIRAWGIKKSQAYLSSLLFLFLPGSLLLLSSQNGLKHVAFGFLPLVLWTFLLYIRTDKKKIGVLLMLLVTVILLINAASLLAVLIGFVAIFIAEAKNNKNLPAATIEHLVGKTVLLIGTAICLSTLWYTPGYWWVVLANPSFGGVPFFRLVVNITNALVSFLPLILALLVVKWRHINVHGYQLFCLLFLVSFSVLTAFRFIADPDFIMDWMGFGLEIQWGVSLLIGAVSLNYMKHTSIKKVGLGIMIGAIVLFWGNTLKNIIMYTQNSYQEEISGLIDSQKTGDKRAFLSGSPVFWINTTSSISQVRGGNDSVSVSPFWADASYQIREGKEKDLTDYWLKILGASYLLVHTNESQEPFHDFKHPEKFTQYKVLSAKNGDYLYHVPGISLAYIADTSLLSVPPPTNGADPKSLSMYVLALKKPVKMEQRNPTTIILTADLKKDEVLSLAMTYYSSWKISSGQGNIVRNSFGNSVIIPDHAGKQTFILEYKKGFYGGIVSVVLSALLLLSFWKYTVISPHIKKKLPSLSIGLKDEDKEY